MGEIIRQDTGERMSREVIHNGVAYLCGQVAKVMVPDIKEQTRTMLEKVDELLAAAGSSRKHILSALSTGYGRFQPDE